MWWNGSSWKTLTRVTFAERRVWELDGATMRRKQKSARHKLGNEMARG